MRRRFAAAWSGIALTLTFVDDIVAGPVLAAAGALVGGHVGVAVGTAAFTVLVTLVVGSTALTSRALPPGTRDRIDRLVASAASRPVIGRHIHRVGDRHPWPTATVAALVSPVLAVLLARMVHPTQRLIRTTIVSSLAYGLGFALFYSGIGAGAAALT